MTEPASQRRDLAVAGALFVGLLVLYLLLRQEDHLVDGRLLIGMVERRLWIHHHVLFLPFARVAYAVLGTLGASVEATLFLISAGSAGFAAAATFLAARTFGFRPTTAAGAALLAATTPVVWFYATCIEIHTFQLAWAAATVLWVARADRRDALGRGALAPALFLAGLAGAHMVGLLWAPALAFLVFRGTGSWRAPRRLVAASLVLAAFAAYWLVTNLHRVAGPGHLVVAARRLLDWSPEAIVSHLRYFRDELLVPAGGVYPLALLALFVRRPAGAAPFHRRILLAALILFLTFLPFTLTFHIEIMGGYFVSLIPVASMAVCAGLDALRVLRYPVLVLVLALQVHASLDQVVRWRELDARWEWTEDLFAESGESGTVVTYDGRQDYAIRTHSDLRTINLEALRARMGEGFEDAALRRIQLAVERDEPVALTREVLESDDPVLRRVVRTLVERHGDPVPGRRPEYAFLVPPRRAR